MRDLGARDDVSFHTIEDGNGPWIPGRGAMVKVGDISVGEFGEIDPTISEKFGLKVPIQAGEFDVEALASSIPDPLL
jgi:phenylalanyl-tRNA synthetase beta subunit